jgi:hypothetical protein
MSCYEILKEKGYNLMGYSPDTIIQLMESNGTEEECESLFYALEVEYG